MKPPKSKPKPQRRLARSGPDLAFLQGPTEDGQGARVVRLRDGVLSAGELRPAREGEPLHEREVVRVRPLPLPAPICEIEVLYDGSTSADASRSDRTPADDTGAVTRTEALDATRNEPRQAPGPARVASDSYRRNWSAIFGGSRRKAGDYSVN